MLSLNKILTKLFEAKSNCATKRKFKQQICWRIERQTKNELMPKMCPWFDGPRRNTENSTAVVVNRIKTRIVWKTECQPFSSHCQLSFPPPFLCFPLHLLSIRCVTLSLMARLSFRRSLALWLTVGKAWIMFTRTGTDRPSCAVDLFISWTYLNETFSVPRGAWDEMSVWIGRRDTKKKGKKSKRQESVLHM